jgi:hypothetical protein
VSQLGRHPRFHLGFDFFQIPNSFATNVYCPKRFRRQGRQFRYVRIQADWQSVFDDFTPPDWIQRLPGGAQVVELSERNVSIFWDERGGPEALDQIAQAIEFID